MGMYGNEVKKHRGRDGRPYSDAHRGKYRVISELLKDKPANILEIGVGIGWGLERLFDRNCVEKYYGVEATGDCIPFLKKKFKSYDQSKIKIVNDDWLNVNAESVRKYFATDKADFSFCIEVIEHNPPEKYMEFLGKIHSLTKEMFFLSTPNGGKHGKMNIEECTKVLKDAGFKTISVHRWNGTPFYMCTP